MKRLLVLLCLLVFAAHPALAETRSVGYAIWNVVGGNVRVLYIVPDAEAKNIVAAGSPEPTTKQMGDYVLAHLSVIRQGKACAVVDQGQDVGLINVLALTPGIMRFEIVFECADGRGLTLSDTAFSDRMTSHIDFARVQIGAGGFAQHVFTAGAPRMNLPGAGEMPQSDSAMRYAGLGIFHAVRSVDIILFMLALLLVARRRRDFLLAFGALAAGYSLAVLLGSFDLAAPRFGMGPAFSGLLVFLEAATGMAFSLPNPRKGAMTLGAATLALGLAALFFHGSTAALGVLGVGLICAAALFAPGRDNQRLVFLLTAPFLFALLDGFALAGDVAVLALSPAQLAPMLMGFNAATLIGEAILLLCLVAAWFLVPLLRRVVAPGGLVADLAASAFIGCGVFWFGAWLFV